ncbi:3-oxoacyl-(acyl-carrier-protein) synthase [Paenibacillus sp. PastF-1]|nr:3-oxoacyl-(acyl-carrier-protein) synthase [Paenibacillus sp. PastF-2]MDF9850512.1 3-oxoacyl-(acyl-carrier-protein) synthase [Paenibacillus sp. PastM-2]MDF9856238.1 3-oxoacyl-(acyl-carrier-protein) synthase [Paenibacillus sp. PastF-1]MDH6481533.1 3-oxoacyl-(acyl-carrier-protein) synthase [Paenibacillus sp. PastH-2]MDH6509847.1 3-oxoacyl-(acyl-carrier-protein) synthase [Paenibacillus sp. PastM-3]
MSLSKDDIAIIGLDLSMPGCRNQEEVWRFLSAGQVSKGQFPGPRLKRSGLSGNGELYMEGSYFPAIDQFDHKYYHIAQKSAEYMDPNQRLTLLSATRALNDSGCLESIRGTRTGVYGSVNTTQQYQYQLQLQALGLTPDLLGMLNSTIASRINYIFDLKGPAVMTDTACSSSLVSVIQAADELRRGVTDYAVIVSSNVYIKPGEKADKLVDILAADATTKAFDERSTGTSIGEGVCSVVLKRRGDAERDGNYIYGLIKGYAINNDGHTVNMSSPNPLAQEGLIEEAWSPFADQLDRLAFIESHGTGTAVGDSIEFESLTPFFLEHGVSRQSVALTACKSNFGHLDVASGLFSLIKSVMSLERGILLPHPNFRIPNGEIDFEQSVFFIPDKSSPLRRCSLAGVSSFGMTGTNAHVILEGYEGAGERKVKPLEMQLRPYWFPLDRNSFAVSHPLQRLETEHTLCVQFPLSMQQCWEIREHVFGSSHLMVGTAIFEILAQGLHTTAYSLEAFNIRNLHILAPFSTCEEALKINVVIDKLTLRGTVSYSAAGEFRNWLQFELVPRAGRQAEGLAAGLIQDMGLEELEELEVTSQVGDGQGGGLQVSGRWETVDRLWVSAERDRALVKLKAPSGYEREFGLYSFYPSLLDPAFNALNRMAVPGEILFPWLWSEIDFSTGALSGSEFYSDVRIREKTSDNIGNIILSLDITLYDSLGRAVISVRNYKVKNALNTGGEPRSDYFKQEYYVETVFKEQEEPQVPLLIMHRSLQRRLAPDGPVHYFENISELQQLLPSAVTSQRIFLWDKPYYDEATVAEEIYEIGCWLVELNRSNCLKEFHYVGTGLFGRDEMNALSRSVAMGLYSLRLELNFRIRLIDAKPVHGSLELVSNSYHNEELIVLRDGNYHALRFKSLKLWGGESGKLAGRTLLIIGGGSGIGREYARYVASAYPDTDIIAAGRSPGWQGGPPPANIRYLTLDITDEQQVQAFAAGQGRNVEYVLNFAGEPAKGLFVNKTKAEFCERTRSKIQGSYLLGKYFGHAREIIHFASVAGLIGAMGQTEYCAANAYQSGLAAEGGRVRTLNLTGWEDVGMSAGKADYYFEKLHSREGVKLIDRFVHSGVMQASMLKLKAPAEDYSSLFGRPEPAADVFSRPSAASRPAEAGLPAMQGVAEAWKRTLGEDHYDTELSFFEQGGDSISIVQLCDELNRLFPGSFDVTTLFSIPTIKGQAEFMEQTVGTPVHQAVPEAAAPDAAELLDFLRFQKI